MNRYAKPENFASRLRTPLLREHYVYRAFDASGQLLYVGCSIHPIKRLGEHKMHAAWPNQIERIAVYGPYNYETARQLEYEAIETERSLHNYSSERRELNRLRDGLTDFCIDQLLAAGASQRAAIAAAVDLARELLPEGDSMAALVVDDTTIPRARKVVADYMTKGWAA